MNTISVKQLIIALFIVGMGAVVSGCGTGPQGSASGTVTLDGAPLKHRAVLTFVGADNTPRSTETDERGAKTPAEREDPVLVDADQCNRARILARRLERAAEISVVDQHIERGEGRDRDERTGELRLGQEDAGDRDSLSAQPRVRNAAVVRREQELRQPAHDDREAEGRG